MERRLAAGTLAARAARSLGIVILAALASTGTAGAQALPPGWASQDVGAVGLAGSATYSAGTFTVRGAGADIWGTADSFQFVNQLLVGDGEIVARVASMTNTHTYAKAGVMIRETLTAGSRHVLLDLKPGGGVEFMTRAATGGTTSFVAGGSARWLKLARSNGVFTAYLSADGASWTSIGSRSVSMGLNVWVGLVVCSHVTTALNTALFDHVSVQAAAAADQPPAVSITSPAAGAAFAAGTSVAIAATAADGDATPVAAVDFYASDGAAAMLLGTDTTSPYAFTWTNVPAGSYSLTAMARDTANQETTSAAVPITVAGGGGGGGALPEGWASQDIGTVGAAGRGSYDAGTFTVSGAGADVWGTADSFHFANRRLSGDGQIVARVQSMENTNPYAKAGVMIRESLTPGSRHVLLNLKPGGGVEFLSRYASGGTTSFEAAGTGRWLKILRRESTVFEAYVSNDGVAWTMIGSAAMSMSADVWVGLAVCSHDTGALNTAVFDQVAVGDAAGGGLDQPPSVSITSPAANAVLASGTTLTVAADAADDLGVAKVEFYANPGTGNVLVGSDTTSPFSASWANVAAGFYTLSAVAWDTGGQRAYSAPVEIAVTDGGAPALPAGWASRDVGSVGLSGSASYVGGIYTVSGAGADVWGAADAFHFAYQALPADGTISTGVASMDNTHAYAKAGVMIRESLTPGSRHVLVSMKPDGSVEFLARETVGGPTIYVGGGTGRYVKLVRDNGVFSAYVSQGGAGWTPIGRRAIAMAAPAFAGLAVCSHDPGRLNTARFENASIRQEAAGGSAVRISSPPAGATFPPDTVIGVTLDVDLAVVGYNWVELYIDDGTKTGIANYWPLVLAGSASRQLALFGLPPGSYTLTAATEGSPYHVSSPVRFDVSATPGSQVPPSISITNPAPNGVVAPGTMLTAAVTDPDSPIARVDYYAEMPYMNGPFYIGSATGSPYAVPWPALDDGPGEYWVFAVATDATGLATAASMYVWRQ